MITVQGVGVATQIWPHGRYGFEFTGEANHAGTTRMEDRSNAMLSYAVTALAANKQARLAGQRAAFGRLAVTPNGTNAIPLTGHRVARRSLRIAAHLEDLIKAITRQAQERCSRDGTEVSITAESVSAAVNFDHNLAQRIAGALPSLPTQAGRDAGILAGAGVPSAMLFVRNPTGISHSPDESAPMADCLAGVEALADALQVLV